MRSDEPALCDTGPLVALYDSGDPAHRQCHEALESFSGPLLTTWAVITEAMYLLYRWPQRELLWDLVVRGGITIAEIAKPDFERMRDLMAKYADLPMDLADASLVVLAERLKVRKVFSIDRRDFRLYRPRHTRAFEVFP